jgi:hypothetical protein
MGGVGWGAVGLVRGGGDESSDGSDGQRRGEGMRVARGTWKMGAKRSEGRMGAIGAIGRLASSGVVRGWCWK